MTGGSLANSEKARTRRSSDSISLDDDLHGLIHEGAIGGGCRASISSTVSRIGVSEFFTSCAVLRASDCQLAICVRWTSRSRLCCS